jgi:tRNA-2-methylthio-N6-dimethylallyladenosine synthase
MAGRTENNRWVNFPGPASLIGRFVDVVIVKALPQSLRGRIATAEKPEDAGRLATVAPGGQRLAANS